MSKKPNLDVNEAMKRPDYWALTFCHAIRDGRNRDAEDSAREFSELMKAHGWRLERMK